MTPTFVDQVLEESPDAIRPTMGDQMTLNEVVTLPERRALNKYGVELIGTKLSGRGCGIQKPDLVHADLVVASNMQFPTNNTHMLEPVVRTVKDRLDEIVYDAIGGDSLLNLGGCGSEKGFHG
ncbi:hypothetical protein SUGI_0896740 [Cryptomeria japonica]|nr:hypothetical protein SUGI_0896740 [Cryptomeria japonica]